MDTLKGHLFGVDIHDPFGIGNTYDLFIWEPNVIKKNALAAATEVIIFIIIFIFIFIFTIIFIIIKAACTILSIDETVRNP
jgi:hypothetical protein